MGLLYHVHYLELFEWARSDWVRNCYRPYKELEDDGLTLVAVEATVRYHRPAYYDDLLLVTARPLDWGRSRLEFDYRIAREGEPDAIASGRTAHCFVLREGKPVALPVDFRRILESLSATT